MKKHSILGATIVGPICFVLIIVVGVFANPQEVRGELYKLLQVQSSWTYVGRNASPEHWYRPPVGFPFVNRDKIYEDWRYGNWGGINYGSGEPVDDLDRLFKEHDMAYIRARGDSAKERLADAWLLGILKALPAKAYNTSPPGAPEAVQYYVGNTKKLISVSGLARQQAIEAFAARIQFNGYKNLGVNTTSVSPFPYRSLWAGTIHGVQGGRTFSENAAVELRRDGNTLTGYWKNSFGENGTLRGTLVGSQFNAALTISTPGCPGPGSGQGSGQISPDGRILSARWSGKTCEGSFTAQGTFTRH